MIYLIDTDIIIYSLKNYPAVKNNFRKHENDPKTISVITYGELVFGAKKSEDYHKNIPAAHRISELFPLVEVTKAIIETFAGIKADLQKQGNIIDDIDLLIAATAITMNYTLVTNNERHFSRVPGLQIENWSLEEG